MHEPIRARSERTSSAGAGFARWLPARASHTRITPADRQRPKLIVVGSSPIRRSTPPSSAGSVWHMATTDAVTSPDSGRKAKEAEEAFGSVSDHCAATSEAAHQGETASANTAGVGGAERRC